MGAPRIALLICGGLASIIGAGQVSVAAASALARALGLSETLIGLTIVAIGTSLPELITSIVATKRGETAIAIGNVIGSNLFNILLILGVSCFIAPIAITAYVFADCILLFAASIVLFFLAKHGALSRRTGYALLFSYGAYLYWVVVR